MGANPVKFPTSDLVMFSIFYHKNHWFTWMQFHGWNNYKFWCTIFYVSYWDFLCHACTSKKRVPPESFFRNHETNRVLDLQGNITYYFCFFRVLPCSHSRARCSVPMFGLVYDTSVHKIFSALNLIIIIIKSCNNSTFLVSFLNEISFLHYFLLNTPPSLAVF